MIRCHCFITAKPIVALVKHSELMSHAKHNSDDILLQAEQWMRDGKDVVFATVIASDKPEQFLLGSQMIINEYDDILGERLIVDDAIIAQVMIHGEPLTHDVNIEGAKLQLYIERLG